MKKYNIPGVSIAIIEKGNVIFNYNYGFADKGKKTTVKGDTIFQVGSISKTITAWGIMKLVDEGKLELDASIEKKATSAIACPQ
ncbi:hypothetical protein SH2C18_31320 [Clostridium sediminicola]